MSWKATAWAKETRGHKGMASKMLLLVLADYHDAERGYAWPSQQRLAEDCEMSLRTVKYALAWLEQAGFITTLQRGNQYQETRYRLNIDVALAQSYEGAMDGSATFAPTSTIALAQSYEGADPEKLDDKVQVQSTTSAGAIHVGTSLHSPPLPFPSHEPPLERGRETLPPVSEEDKTVWPDWYGRLWDIPGFQTSLPAAQAWLVAKGISVERAEETAYALKSKWPGPTRGPYRDVWATFQNWCKRPPLATNGSSPSRAGRGKLPDPSEYAKVTNAKTW